MEMVTIPDCDYKVKNDGFRCEGDNAMVPDIITEGDNPRERIMVFEMG